MDINKQDYIARLSNATPLQLVIITYDIMLEHIDSALINVSDYSNLSDDITKTQKLLSTLITSLNLEIDISKELLNLYMYINKLLLSCTVKINLKNKEEELKVILIQVKQILTSLLHSWKSIDDTDEPVMANSQQIFAGFTYEKNGKLTEFIDENSSISYKA